MMYAVQGLSALDTALWGMRESSGWMESAAQKVALGGADALSLDRVSLSSEALRTMGSPESASIQDGLIDLGVASSLYTANASVVEVLGELDRALLGIV